ncbi:MerR family transcriptional regulator [Vallitaleaceae bacterium 9-2]
MMLSIKEAAIKVELTPHTLRYYESEGLIPFLQRDEQGHRVYRKKDIEWIQFILCLRNTGMSIREMKSFVKLYKGGEETIPDRMEILYEHKKLIEDQLRETKWYLNNINNKIAYYESINKEYLNSKEERKTLSHE